MSIELMMPSNHLILPSIFPSIKIFSSESSLHIRWPKYWSFSFSISPSSEYSELISFRIDSFDLAVQRTLKSLLQHHSLKASILRCSAFFMVQLNICTHDYSHKIKRCLLLKRKSMMNLDSVLKSREITLPTKVCLVKAMVFPVVKIGRASCRERV